MKQIDNLVSVTKNNNIVITPENDKEFFLSYLRNNINVLNEKDAIVISNYFIQPKD